MKAKIYLLIVSAVMILFAASCGKDGATGPQGPKGDQGPIGPAGTNGSVIYSGQVAPPSTTGANGDYYIDLSAGMLYGPKTDSGWGTGISLKGPAGSPGAAGAAGAAGSQIYSGTGAPGANLGITGDYYLDKANYALYGPKESTRLGNSHIITRQQYPVFRLDEHGKLQRHNY